jgi:pimeloyl-ACP methyl ester carboxylesterase
VSIGISIIEALLAVAVLCLFVMWLLAPFEVLTWWAGWFGSPQPERSPALPEPSPAGHQPRYWAVYFSGVGDVSGDFAFPEEIALLQRLRETLPELVIVDDIFPYSVTNAALTARRPFLWLWNYLVERRSKYGDGILTWLINFRNFLQVLVCSDGRYGPVYGYGVAELVRDSLRRAGYPAGSGQPITLIGFSGGAQVCLSASTFVRALLGAPVQIVSLGGILGDDPALRDVHRLYNLHGTRDWIQRCMALLFPGRWQWMRHSSWNRALREGRIREITLGPMRHNDPGGYFDADQKLPNGKSHAQTTLDHISEIIRSSTALKLPPGRFGGVESLGSIESQTWDFDSHPAPTRTFADALQLLQCLQELDGSDLHPGCRTAFLHHGSRTERCFVLIHGWTNCPLQWRLFGEELHRRGHNVLIPRLPRHGLANRLTESIAELTAEELLIATDTAIDLARGAGKEVTVAGVSLGAVLAAWAALHRRDLSEIVLIAPSFSYRLIPRWLESTLIRLLWALPNFFVWWDPRVKADAPLRHAYPRFPTHGLHQSGRIVRDVMHETKRAAPQVRRAVVITNDGDLAARNRTVEQLVRQWRSRGLTRIDTHAFESGWKLEHDLIDPAQPNARVHSVYPVLLRLMEN